MNKKVLITAAVCFMALAASTGMAGVASAQSSVALGGGSGIALPDVPQSDPNLIAVCTLTAVGFDNSGSLVGLTAGHCGQVGDRVYAESAQGAGPVGWFSYKSGVSDIAVVDLDDSMVVPVRTVGGTTINGIGSRPGTGTFVCKEGRSTGRTCAFTLGYNFVTGEIIEHTCSIPGDSGGPLMVGDLLVGVISNGPPPYCSDTPSPFYAPDNSADINIGLADINAHGGGFRLF